MSESSSGWLPSRNFGLQKFRRYKKRFQKRFVHQLLRKQNTQDSIYLNSGLIAFKVFELQWLSYSARDFHWIFFKHTADYQPLVAFQPRKTLQTSQKNPDHSETLLEWNAIAPSPNG